MYRKGGMDFGPFSTRDIQHLIESGDLSADSELYSVRVREWYRLGNVPKFRQFMAEIQQKAAETARQKEIQRDTAKVKRHSANSYRLPVILLLLVVGGGAGATWYFTRPPELAKGGLPVSFYRDMSFPSLKPLAESIAAPIEITREPEPIVPSRAVVRKTVKPRQSAKATEVEVEGAPIVDLSFDSPSADGRELTREDLDKLQQAVTPGLIRCFRSEAAVSRDFRGGSVTLYVMNKGSVVMSRIATEPSAGPELRACAKAAVGRQKIPPFVGGAQIMEIPLRVAGVQ